MALYKRILLKLSGEALKGENKDILDRDILQELTNSIKELQDKGLEIGIVVGGGNIFRGRIADSLNLERVNADFMGMTATNINGLMLENVFKINNLKAKAYSMLPIKGVIDEYNAKEANKLLKQGYVVIFAGGTGKPYFSTDTAAALKAQDIKAEIILAGKNGVDGVYDSDPATNPEAKLLKDIPYDYFIESNLKALDVESIKICKENKIMVRVFNMNKIENITKVVEDKTIGTIIK